MGLLPLKPHMVGVPAVYRHVFNQTSRNKCRYLRSKPRTMSIACRHRRSTSQTSLKRQNLQGKCIGRWSPLLPADCLLRRAVVSAPAHSGLLHENITAPETTRQHSQSANLLLPKLNNVKTGPLTFFILRVIGIWTRLESSWHQLWRILC